MLIVVDPTRVARRLRVRGVVQGVGFRPFVYRYARSLGLVGWVRNDGGGVEIEVQGSEPLVEAFTRGLVAEAPPLARIDTVEPEVIPPEDRRRDFAMSSGSAESVMFIRSLHSFRCHYRTYVRYVQPLWAWATDEEGSVTDKDITDTRLPGGALDFQRLGDPIDRIVQLA